MIKPNKLLVSVAVSMALYGGNIYAEEANVEEEDSNVVIITASKRPTSLQETPIAITVINEESIEQTKIQDIFDLQSLVPTLRVSPLQRSTNTTFSLRGFANGANNTGIEPSVGVFIDGVYRSRAAAQIGDLPRLEQIEVLSGPQSTLFGKNASAGVINVRTKAPSYDLEGKVEIGLGNYNQRLVKVYVTNGISDNVAFSLSAVSSTRDGYTNSITNAQGEILGKLNDRDRSSFRGQLLWEPSDDVSFRLIADSSEIDEVCCTIANSTNGPALTAIQLLTGGTPIFGTLPNGDIGVVGADGGVFLSDEETFAYESALNFNPRNTVEDSGISLEANVDFDGFSFTSITALRNNDSTSLGDVDFGAADILKETIGTDIETTTQEFRLTSTGENKFDWMVGTFIFQEDIVATDRIQFGTQTRALFDILAPGLLAGVEGVFPILDSGSIMADETGATTDYTQANDAYSVFATFDYKFTDQLTVTLGLAYTNDEKEVSIIQDNNDALSSLDLSTELTVFGTTFAGMANLPSSPITDGAIGLSAFLPVVQSFQFLQPLLALNADNTVEDRKSSDDDLTWSLRMAYEFNENVNLFTTASTGFKATSWNLSRDTKPLPSDLSALNSASLARGDQKVGTRFAGPEESSVYEIGIKTRFEKGAFNITYFDQTIDGFQSSIFAGTGFILANAGQQNTKGIEFDSIYTPTENLTLSLAGSFLDPVYDSFVKGSGIPGTPNDPSDPNYPYVDSFDGTVDLSGQKTAGIHEQSIVVGVKFDFELASGSYAYIRTDYIYESKVRTVRNTPENLTREVSTINASAGLSFLNGVNVQLWVRNLNEDEYFYSSAPTPIQTGSFFAYPNQPKTYGVSVSYEF